MVLAAGRERPQPGSTAASRRPSGLSLPCSLPRGWRWSPGVLSLLTHGGDAGALLLLRLEHEEAGAAQVLALHPALPGAFWPLMVLGGHPGPLVLCRLRCRAAPRATARRPAGQRRGLRVGRGLPTASGPSAVRPGPSGEVVGGRGWAGLGGTPAGRRFQRAVPPRPAGPGAGSPAPSPCGRARWARVPWGPCGPGPAQSRTPTCCGTPWPWGGNVAGVAGKHAFCAQGLSHVPDHPCPLFTSVRDTVGLP